MLSAMGAFAEFVRSLIRERQRERIALVKQRGVHSPPGRLISNLPSKAPSIEVLLSGAASRLQWGFKSLPPNSALTSCWGGDLLYQ